MTEDRTGGCLCGKTRYRSAGEPAFTIRCYCRDCQRMTGAGSAPQLAVARDGFALEGPASTYSLKSDAGYDVELTFCGTCGSPICKATNRAPDLVMIFAGSLDDASAFEIGNKVYEDRRQPWDTNLCRVLVFVHNLLKKT